MFKYLLLFLLTISIYSNPIILLNKNDLKKIKSFQPYIYGQRSGEVKVLAENTILKYLNKYDIKYKIIYKSEKEYLLNKKSIISNENFVKYYELVSKIDALVEDYPKLIEKIVIGKSVEGRDIVGIRTISSSFKPKYRIVGGIHGDEAMSYQFVFDFMVYLIENNTNYQEIFKNTEIYFIPMLNPDGAVNVTRRNSNSIDLNRNLGFFWKEISYSGSNNFTEPESKALRDLTIEENFSFSFSFHTFGDYVNYVWNFSPDDVADIYEVLSISNIYGDFTGYTVTEGYDWYQTTGDLNDYSYGIAATLDWTIEIEDSDRTGELFENNKKALLKILATNKYGVEGVVYDENNIAIEATILINDKLLFYSNKNGYFYRYLLNGVYNIKVITSNYKIYETTIEINDNKPFLNIYLERSIEENLFVEKIVSVKANFRNHDDYIDVLLPRNLLLLPDEKYFIMNSKGEVFLKLPKRNKGKYLDLILRDYDNIDLTIEAYEHIDSEKLFSEKYINRDSLIIISPDINYLKIIEDNNDNHTAFIDSILLKDIPEEEKDDTVRYSGSSLCNFSDSSNSNIFILLIFILSIYILKRRKLN